MIPVSQGLASFAVFFAASVWGLYWIPLRYLEDQGFAGMFAVAVLCVPAVLLLSIVMILTRRRYRHCLLLVLLIGLFTGLGLSLYASGVIYSSIVRATLLFYLTPVWATLIEIFLFRQSAGVGRWLAIVGGLAGMGLLLSSPSSIPLNVGDALAFCSGIFWAVGMTLVRHYNAVPLPGLALGQLLFTAIVAAAVGTVFGEFEFPDRAQMVSVSPVLIGVSIGAMMPVVLTIFWGQKSIDPGRAGLLCMSEVIVAVVSASVLLPEERMSVIQWTGAALILSACLCEIMDSPAGLRLRRQV